MTECDGWIKKCDSAVCMNLEKADAFERGYISVNILSQLRNLIDHIGVKLYLSSGAPVSNTDRYYDMIVRSKQFVNSHGKYRDLMKLYELLQISASHYTLDTENSERLMLKYYAYLWNIRKLVADEVGLHILRNLELFPLNTDKTLESYHTAIYESIENLNLYTAQTWERRFYVYGVREIIASGAVIYEVTLTNASERSSKFDHIIAFSRHEIPIYNSVVIRVTTSEIMVADIRIPIQIIVDWEPSIRLCEIRNLGKIFGFDIPNSSTVEYRNLMGYLLNHRCSLNEMVCTDDMLFKQVLLSISQGAKTSHIRNLLMSCRNIILNRYPGHNVVRYLLHRVNNKTIKSLSSVVPCSLLSNLRLGIGCKPFDEHPFSFSLPNHNPRISDLLEAIPPKGREPEFLARFLTNSAEHGGTLYTPVEDLKRFGDIKGLADKYNNSLYYKHDHARIELYKKFAFIKKYDAEVHDIIKLLAACTESGVKNYQTIAENWMNSPGINVGSPEKENALRNLFSDSRVAFIYGAAGTGKSTLINYISHIFAQNDKIYLANTNPAVENIRWKVNAANTDFMTIASYNSRREVECDILFVDECSTVSNGDMLKILQRGRFRLLVLVGDMYQIESIRFGNWFSMAHSHFKGRYVVELTTTYRTSSQRLLDLWDKVRSIAPEILEHITRYGYSSNLDDTIFTRCDDDEIILCLNYGGLYGINNINRILQRNNPNPSVRWGIHEFKKGDPILFNEVDKFAPYLHNNLKGEILDVDVVDGVIYFTLRVDKVLSSLDLEYTQIEYLGSSDDGLGTVVRIAVSQEVDSDYDVDNSDSVIPFQIAYAVSIHKAQGLEYQSVKLIITKNVEEMISHNIFYTAITRSKDKLRIYWSPETEKYVLEHLKYQFNHRDYGILKSRYKDIARK